MGSGVHSDMYSQTSMTARTAQGYQDGVAEVEQLRLARFGTGAAMVRAEETRDRARLGRVETPYKERDVTKSVY